MPSWYLKNGGQVLSTTVNKYCYVSCRYLPKFFNHNYRIVYSKIEIVKKICEIKHPVIRECLKHIGPSAGLEIHHDGDLPAWSGMGTSSAFTVGLLKALYGLTGKFIDPQRLAYEAIDIEQNKTKDIVGSQDQVAAAFGGFNRIRFLKNGGIIVEPIVLPTQRLIEFKNHLLLFFTGINRKSSDIQRNTLKNLNNKKQALNRMSQMVDEAITVLNGGDINDFGFLLNETWQLKRSLSRGISNNFIDKIYSAGHDAGALGGKILGAGGGGFILFFVKPKDQKRLRSALSGTLEVPFEFEDSGSQVTFYKPEISIENGTMI